MFVKHIAMNSPSPDRLLSIVGAMRLISLVAGCALSSPQPKGQIVVQMVSWPLVKKWAEPDAGLPGHKVTLQSAEDHSLIAEKSSDASGILVFDVPAGRYIVLGIGDQSETITVQSGRSVKLKLVQH
jgi:hypothetical protein